MTGSPTREERWRLILGRDAESELGSLYEEGLIGMDESLELLFDKERQSELSESMPRLNRWMGDLRTYFPPKSMQFLQQEAFDQLGITDMLLEPEMLDILEPDIHLAGVLLQSFKSLDQERREAARSIIRQIAQLLLARIQLPLSEAIRGRQLKQKRRYSPPWRDMDWHATIRRNLRHYQPDLKTIIPELRIGYRQHQQRQKELIIVVDQSASMTESVIYAGLYANVLMNMPSVKLTVLAFDTKVLDLTRLSHDPVDMLLGFQLGGGTDIANAVTKAATYIEQPRETIMVLITDLYEGGSESLLLRKVGELKAAGVQLITMLTLSQEGSPDYNAALAHQFHQRGIPAFACSPDVFPEIMSKALAGEEFY